MRTASTWTSGRSRNRTRSTTCSAAPTASACSRWSHAPRWPPCRGCAPAASTTSWWRWPSSVPDPSRAARCIPTSGDATAPSRSRTCIPCSKSPSPRRWASRCSRNSSCRWPSTLPASPPLSPTSCDRPWDRSAHVSGWGACASGSSGAWPSGGWSATWPSGSGTRWSPSPTTAFPRAIRCRSRTSCTPRRGSSCTTPQRSARRC